MLTEWGNILELQQLLLDDVPHGVISKHLQCHSERKFSSSPQRSCSGVTVLGTCICTVNTHLGSRASAVSGQLLEGVGIWVSGWPLEGLGDLGVGLMLEGVGNLGVRTAAGGGEISGCRGGCWRG